MRKAILVIGLAGLFLAKASEGYAADIEAVLDDNAGLSEFVVKDSDNTQVWGVSPDGDIALTDTTATVAPWIGLGESAGKIEFDDQATDEINLLNCNVGIGMKVTGEKFMAERPYNAPWGKDLSVNFAAMTDLNDMNSLQMRIDLVDYAIVAEAQAVATLFVAF